VLALARGDDPLAGGRAAGSLVGRRSVLAGAMVHAVLSLWWATVIAGVLSRARCPRALSGAAVGATCGAAICVLDLEVVGRRIPAVAALPGVGQWLDHLAFGALAGALSLSGTRR
jgi:hypothetical protein